MLERGGLGVVEQDFERVRHLFYGTILLAWCGAFVGPQCLTFYELNLTSFCAKGDIYVVMPWRKGNRLHLVQEKEAAGRIAVIFEELKSALGITYIPLCFQAFAAYPSFLEAQWRAMKPLLATREFFDLAGRLRAESYTYVHSYFKVPALDERLTSSPAAPVVDLLWYVQPAMLLLLTVQVQAFDGAVGNADTPHAANRMVNSDKPEFVDADNASVPVRRALEEMRHALDLPFSGDEQLALAQWSELLFSYWQGLKPMVQSVFHERGVFHMRESAWNCAHEIPIQVDLEYSRLVDASVSANEIATLTHLTELLVRGTAAGLLNLAFAKIGIEGGNGSQTQDSTAEQERVA